MPIIKRIFLIIEKCIDSDLPKSRFFYLTVGKFFCMEVIVDLLKDSVKKFIFQVSFFPSMGSAVVASVYLMTDAVVIGKGIGDNALAALNMTTPIISFMLSIGILFGIGGSVLFSVHKGTGDDENANKCFTTALLGVLTAAIIICVLFNIFDKQILSLMGAKRRTF